ncbi:MAG: ABC transporter permease subunit [Isosphaeraceae bacterium]|nr:ABC transporter permease subunit [Isosphaeraceae bacterium]
MEEEPDPSEADPPGGPPSPAPPTQPIPSDPRARSLVLGVRLVLAALVLMPAGCGRAVAGNALDRVRCAGVLRYGSDAEGGGPYAYPNPERPREVIGFEVELMQMLAGELGPRPELVQGQWDQLLEVLNRGMVDAVVNGYELTPSRVHDYLPTRPYYIFQLQLMAPRGGRIHSWEDVQTPRADRRRWRLGVLGGSAAEAFAKEHGGPQIEVHYFNGATDAMMAVANGQMDATLQDLPAARFYQDRFPTLELAGPPVGRGYYVMYLRKGDEALRDALNRGIERLLRSGDLRRLYERYGIWTDLQDELAQKIALAPGGSATQESDRGWSLLVRYGPTLLEAAGMTILLSVTSMPLAMVIGLLIALGRLYGPAPIRRLLGAYVEIIRGTPLMLQLFVLFFLLPQLNISLPPLVAGIGGLALNYSAYEAEIYRAGLQAIPAGQMEAALALGMTRRLALRRVIVPQAVRIVIPPVTNDFIALFKDTSVCSVITLVELTKQYSILANSTGGVIEFAIATALLYLVMSLPLSWLSRWSEGRLGAEGRRGALV